MEKTEDKFNRPIFRQDDKVRVTFNGRTVFGYVKLASPTGKNLMILCPDVMIGGYLELLPVIWNEGQKTFVDLIEDKPFKITTVVN